MSTPRAETDATPAVLTATTAALTFAAMTALFPAAIAPALGAALGVPAALVGLQISLVYGGAMTSSLIGGALTRRVGACRATQAALLLLGGGAALAALPSLAAFALASVLIGLGYGMTNPAASHLLARFTPSGRRGLVFSIKQTGVPLGGVLAGALAPALALGLGWQWALAALLLPAALGVLLLQPRRKAWDDDRERGVRWLASPLADLRLVWAHRPLRLLSLAGFCFAAIQLSLSVFTVTLLVEDLGVPLVQAGLVMSAVQVTGVVGRVLWGWAADRLGSGLVTLMLAAGVTAAGTLATAAMTPLWPLWLVAATLCAFSFSALGWNGVYLAEVSRLAPRQAVARASGGSLFFTFGGVLVGPPLFSALRLALGSYSLTFGALLVVAAGGIACVFQARRLAGRD
ncbi:MFS transporter [Spiribacter halobius]|nr:MFS transporter [Spiribacter halobius]UEX77786.1 MFS transporter [Spiribacter halobius]